MDLYNIFKTKISKGARNMKISTLAAGLFVVILPLAGVYGQGNVQKIPGIGNFGVRGSDSVKVKKPDPARIAEMIRDVQDVSLDVKENKLYPRRAHLVDSLGTYRITEAFDVLVKLLWSEPNFHVRVASASALGKLGDNRAVPVLLKACDDESVQIRLFSAHSLILLGMYNDKKVFTTLQAIAMGDGKDEWKTKIEPTINKGSSIDINSPVMKKLDEEVHKRTVSYIRKNALTYLNMLNPISVKPVLETLKADPDTAVSAAADKILKSPKYSRIKK
jgi:hypothetical protein